ncbi:phospholipase C, phosphocholine-specific [Variovorax sp. J2L1-78]|uniref:phosphocholine-specific phospholipase C n=1 Tax=Variovorax arabinosiphilus TaxID=3053498 RepID=UPI002577B6A3|nr:MULTISPECIES: phospholipase C, phosphocholine-specific [unclassified Variovorax]MDM0123351.1 phospholipase C, phosphocholine-specific [Variovorax sp. J2L1-78]MDM0132410.1 phospholipase C, phosphocholine-specific [Variovorax sp. J2L1-63]MDM0231057.1 phospholipase C, phosphocholine-specific [Variovorax sp. J2R1-6]
MSQDSVSSSRRGFLRGAATAAGATAALGLLPPSIRRALAIPAAQDTGTISDVKHVVILMQENRAFDHYFGTLRGVRGFGDRFPVPLANGKPVWYQPATSGTGTHLPFHYDTTSTSAQRTTAMAHSWPDGQQAWNGGQMNQWVAAKTARALGYYQESDMPFQFALADAFTVCDAYHCSELTGTNSNRLFLWTGSNDPLGQGGGPAIDNTNDDLANAPGYSWTTYPERLEAAGVSWQIYQDMADNFTDNPLEGFTTYREAYYATAPTAAQVSLKTRALSTRDLDALADDVKNDRLPQVSWIVAPAKYSEHPGPSSPLWGAEYTERVLDALTSDPAVWSKTVLFLMFDENDGYFDHMPPPAIPSRNADGTDAGMSTVSTLGERNDLKAPYLGSPYGMGWRVPMYVVSPWSRGGWVNSQVSDHTSVIRFLEARFGVVEPNISAWRRSVSGDLTTCFNFATPNAALPTLPTITSAAADAAIAQQLLYPTPTAPAAGTGTMPVQATGVRYSRALPYELHTSGRPDVERKKFWLVFGNTGRVGAVYHVYNHLALDKVPRRYTVEPGKLLNDSWAPAADGGYDLSVFGPNGYFRRFRGKLPASLAGGAGLPEIRVCYDTANGDVHLEMQNLGNISCTVTVTPSAYRTDGPWSFALAPGQLLVQQWDLSYSKHWYDFSVSANVDAGGSFLRRFAGRVETGADGISDPEMGLVT